MPPAPVRRPVASRARRVTPKSVPDVTPDELANRLAKRLTISDPKGKKRATPQPAESRRDDAMRAVNSASKSLSAIAESGWKASEPRQTAKRSSPGAHTHTSVLAVASEAGKSLSVLRGLDCNALDVERAAASVAGKLIILEMYDLAVGVLADMHPVLTTLYDTNPSPPSQQEKSPHSAILSLPIPISVSDSVLTLISTYLLHALTAVSYLVCSKDYDSTRIDSLASTLHDNPTLVHWLPHLSAVSSKHRDSLLTRAYTALTKCTANVSGSLSIALSVYRIRFYGLLCLAHTSPSVLEPTTFWNQVVKFAAAYAATVVDGLVGSGSSGSLSQSACVEDDATQVILTAYREIVACAIAREDSRQFMSGRGFIGFCEHWTGFAKRVRDYAALSQVADLLQSPTPSPSQVSSTANHLNEQSEARQREEPKARDRSSLECARLCNALAQAGAALDQWTEQQFDIVSTKSTVAKAGVMLVSPVEPSIVDKTRRALERLRRTATKVLDGSPADTAKLCARAVLEDILCVLEQALTDRSLTATDVLTPAVDTLFTLARSTLSISQQDTYSASFDFLSRATALVARTPDADITHDARANYLRCISGTFHNLAGALYQTGRYAHAIRFLYEGCMLGKEALRIRGDRNDDVQGNDDEGWKQLGSQLSYRWEVLGVCHLKTGDRKSAFDAWTECIKTYAFTPDFMKVVRSSALATVFDPASPHAKIGTLVDRVTYMGVCELFKGSDAVSMRCWFQDDSTEEARQKSACIAGVLLEKQLEGLESSKRKDGVRGVMSALLHDALTVYTPEERPVRRARVLLKYLEYMYYNSVNLSEEIPNSPDMIGEEIESLLLREDMMHDCNLAPYRPQYLATMHLWLALHIHRQAEQQPSTSIVTHTEQACKILKATMAASPRHSGPKAKPTTKVAPRRAIPRAIGLTRGVSTRARAAKAVSVPPVTPKPVAPKPRKALETVTLNVGVAASPPTKDETQPKDTMDFSNLIGLLQITTQLLGLLGHVVAQIQLLGVTRRLCERHMGTTSDEYIKSSVDLAHEYVKLGKTEKAASIYAQAHHAVKEGKPSAEVRTVFFLRYAESLATVGNLLRSSSIYCEALALSDALTEDVKGMSTAQRVKSRVLSLERAAMAASAFSAIQRAKDDPTNSINGLLQSLRLWNRAFDMLERLNAPPPVVADSNPFEMTDVRDALPQAGGSGARPDFPPVRKTFRARAALDGLEWRIADGLLGTLFALTQSYFARGSAREAEYFAEQAQELAESLHTPAMVCRALARNGEIKLHMGLLEEGYACLMRAADMVTDIAGPDAIDIRRLRGDYSQANSNTKDAQQLYGEAVTLLDELEKTFTVLDGATAAGSRKSLGVSPKSPQVQSSHDTLAPTLLAAVLRQHIWLLRDAGEEYKALLERFHALPPSTETKAEESALMAKLTLDEVYSRFRADMFLSSLAESTITLPMGMSSVKASAMSPSTHEVLGTLKTAEKLFWSDLSLIARRGNVSHVRDAVISLALIRALQSSLGTVGKEARVVVARLIDSSSAITLRREVVEVIQHKFPEFASVDDVEWPLITPNGSPMPPRKNVRKGLLFQPVDPEDSYDDEDSLDDKSLKQYWEFTRKKYQAQTFDVTGFSASQTRLLPKNWTVVSISVTEDRNTMFITRQRTEQDPLIFCLPLKGRRDSEDDEHLTFDDALSELQDIIVMSDESTRQAANVKKDDKEARAAWWASRTGLDKRLRELLENIEFCWLGAFKTILSPPATTPPDILAHLRAKLDKVFKHGLVSQETKRRSRIRLDDALLQCFSTISSKCRDEELEDLVYFIFDLYQFHGIPVAIAEVDVDQVVVDLRAALEEHSTKAKAHTVVEADEHLFLVLDKNVQGIPWESIPILRGRSVSRIPSMEFLLDRVQFARWQKGLALSADPAASDDVVDRVQVDPRKTYYILNPSADLKGTEARFAPWLHEMKTVGWEGVVGRPPSEQQLLDALARKDLVIYFGHGGAEQYVRSHKIRHLPRCAATMLWGCSSGALRDMGDFDRVGTPYNYVLAGCPTLIANLWDVTDRDIDKFSQAVFDKMRLDVGSVREWRRPDGHEQTSIVSAVGQSRDCCKLKYLTGAAPVVYGIPFYL